MKFKLRVLLIPVLALLLAACASGPKYSEVASGFAELDPAQGRIYVYRPSSFGAAVRPDVRLNGEVVGEAISHGFFFVDRAPGDYTISTSTEVDRSLSFILNAGQTRYVRLGISIGFVVGHVFPELVESSQGEEEIQKLSYTGGR